MMGSFSYTAKDSLGRLISGSLDTQSRKTAVSVLKKKGYFLLSVESQGRLLTACRRQLGQGRFSIGQRAMFTQQLATLLAAGMHLSIALKTLTSQADNKKFAAIIEQLHHDIEGSSSLSAAMSKHPRAFPAVYTAIVRAAEETGMLSETLSNLSRQLKAQASVNRRIRSAMTYPIFLLAVGGMVVTVLMSFVMPRFVELFINAEQQLPLPTQILIGSIELVKRYWWLLLSLPVGLVSLFWLLWRQENTRLSIDGFLLRIPLIGSLNRELQLARFARTLGVLLTGGVRIIDALGIVQKTSANRAFSQGIAGAAEKIAKGTSLAKAIKGQKYFSGVMANMVAVGQESGTLPEMLLEVADIYDQESETVIGTITNLLGPIMIIFLGLLIGFVVLAILLPIFETGTIIG